MQISSYPASSNSSLGLVDIQRGPDGALWFLDSAGSVANGTAVGHVGRVSTPTSGNSMVTKIITSYLSPTLQIDGSACNTPCVKNWVVGSSHTIGATTSPGPLYQFYGWSDGGAITHTTTADWGPMIYVANFFNLTACNVAGTPTLTITSFQDALNQAMGIAKPTFNFDGDGVVNVTDTQTIVNALLGNGCVAP
jgi:hypothetical protein